MIKNIKEFAEVVTKHHDNFKVIPEEYLNDDGKAIQCLYRQLYFDLDFAGTCADMLQIIRDGSEYNEIHNASAIKELRMIERCLEKIGNL